MWNVRKAAPQAGPPATEPVAASPVKAPALAAKVASADERRADWLIDLGPEGGDKGGMVIATGTPEEVAIKAGSATGEYLKRLL